MQTVKIKVPIWHGRKVGIDESLIEKDGVNIEILYRDKSGKQIYPHLYYISRYEAMLCPTQNVKGVKLRLIPISMLKIKEERIT